MMLLNTILGGDGDLDTRLSREVRTRRGLVYAVGSTYDSNEGRFTVWFESTNRQFAAARTAVRDVVNEMRIGTVTAEERGRAYHKLVALALRGQASPDGILDNLADAANNHRTPDDAESLAALYGAVSRDDIHRLAAKELRLDQATEVVKGRAP
jgi:predicted Zn-dependent peptidase